MTGHPGPARTLAVHRLRNAWGGLPVEHSLVFEPRAKPMTLEQWERSVAKVIRWGKA